MSKALPTFLENTITLELPLKYPEVYHVIYTPEFPSPLVSTIALLFSIVPLFRQSKVELQLRLHLIWWKSVLFDCLQVYTFPLLFMFADDFSVAQYLCAIESDKTLVISPSRPKNVAPAQSGEFHTITSQSLEFSLLNTFQQSMIQVPQSPRATQK